MIPFALKQAWFWLALTGLIQCWITLIFFGRKVGGLWGRLYYCVFVTLLEGMFCIGMVWHMNPSSMPHQFCIAQVISFSLGSFALTGLCASFALACARAVFRPRTVNTGRAVLAWHPRYIPLLIFFPCVACIVHVTLLITLDAVQPELSDDLHCDATRPIWMRLVGYAGVPLIITIPFLVLSILTAYRLYQVRRVHSTRGTYIADGGDVYEDDYGPADTRPYGPDGPKRRSALSLNAFLPYPGKARFKKSDAIPPIPHSAFIKEAIGYPLHKHPFPVIDPLTGNPYSPSIEEHDVGSFTVSATSLRMVQANNESHGQQQQPSTNNPRTLTPRDHVARPGTNTPDSAVSSTIPVFVTTPALTVKSSDAAMASGSSVRLSPSGESGDAQVGLAITTDDIPSPRVSSDMTLEVDDGAAVGLAVTTDEPERMLTPTPQPLARVPPQKNGSPTPSDTNNSSDTPRPHDSGLGRSPSDLGTGLRERARSSESITRASPVGHPLQQLAHLNYSSPHPSSHPPPSSSPGRHQRQSSFVSSGTVYSSANAYPDREDRNLLAFSPASASSFQSPTYKDKSEDLAHDMGIAHLSSGDKDGDQDRDDEDTKNLEWEDDEYDHDHDMPMRTVNRRDPRERLGVYNPTPPMGPTAVVLERRRRTLQKEMHIERNTKLGNVIWRMILFQIAFFAIQLLACLSSVLDVAHNTITPFGTQHVALLLAAWGPLCIFVHVPTLPRFLRRRQ